MSIIKTARLLLAVLVSGSIVVAPTVILWYAITPSVFYQKFLTAIFCLLVLAVSIVAAGFAWVFLFPDV